MVTQGVRAVIFPRVRIRKLARHWLSLIFGDTRRAVRGGDPRTLRKYAEFVITTPMRAIRPWAESNGIMTLGFGGTGKKGMPMSKGRCLRGLCGWGSDLRSLRAMGTGVEEKERKRRVGGV